MYIITFSSHWYKWNHNLKHSPPIITILFFSLKILMFVYCYFSDIVAGKGDDGESIYGPTFEGLYLYILSVMYH